MLTPKFELSQTADELELVLECKSIKTLEIQIHINGKDLKVFAMPYYLHLIFPGEIQKEGAQITPFDEETGIIGMKFLKNVSGEDFGDLRDIKAIEIDINLLNEVNEEEVTEEPTDLNNDEPLNLNKDECVEGNRPLRECNFQLGIRSNDLPNKKRLYGFDKKYSGILGDSSSKNEIIEFSDPENISLEEKREIQRKNEDEQFDPNYYIADQFNPRIEELLSFQSSFDEFHKILSEDKNSKISDVILFSNEEKELLNDPQMRTCKFFKLSIIVENTNVEYVLYGLVDILYAFLYELRVTEEDFNVESTWTITKISSTISCLSEFKCLKDVLVSCYRRSLTYPLYRNWDLCNQVLKDLQKLLNLGKRGVLKALIKAKTLFEGDELRFLVNELFLDDYCAWVLKSCTEKSILNISNSLRQQIITKQDVLFPLEEFDQIARETDPSEFICY
ncbi:SHQ1 protein domain-containing protein [Rozella allomycis CSF55]|uniref:SHQ1 protein domain-containing protein n=1 Tax=Rozella allomycis (strain CSF55) TaxID=988480 RepID=A0A075B3G2_ROZAC|nr:SHQ1 protein domain-containing protein [Rozella allomycis CSF55]|eukprot:EPZ36906.1 SHQ1 protein domain-containing protein [Rozella allomycis CSF55]